MAVFEREGKIVDVLEDGKVLWTSEKVFVPWTSNVKDIEFWPPRIPKKHAKRGRMSKAELEDVRARLPELKESLKPDEALQDLHLALGDWLIQRDVARYISGEEDIPIIPTLLYPEIVVQLVQGAHEEVREQAGLAMTGLWMRQGLLGVPIAAGGHWTLLVLRRSGGSRFKIFQEEFVEVRYYESLEGFSESCWKVAEQVLNFLLPNLTPEKVRENRTYQGDVIKCGAFLLHYWEGRCPSISDRDGS